MNRSLILLPAFWFFIFQSSLASAQAPIVAKSFTPTAIAAGGLSTLTVRITNNGVGVSEPLVQDFIDHFPAGMTVAVTPNSMTTCPGGSVVAAAGSGSFILKSPATIPAAGCVVSVNVTASQPSVFTNTIPAGSVVNGFGPNIASASATLTVLEPPTVTKQFSPTSIPVGGISTLTITLGNANSGAITLTSDFVDTLPSNLTVAAFPNVGGTCSATVTTTSGSVTVKNGSAIPAGGCTVSVSVTTNSPGTYINSIPSGTLQTNAGNNSTPASATINALAPMSIGLQFNPFVIVVYSNATLTITVTNPNNVAQTGVSFTNTFPTGLLVAIGPNVTNTCGGTVFTSTSSTSLSGGTVPSSTTCAIGVPVTSISASTYTDDMTPGAISSNSGITNSNFATALLQFIAAQTTTTLTTACPTTFVANQEFSMTANVTGFYPSGNTTFSDDGVTITGCSPVTLSSGTASCPTSTLSIGKNDLTAAYNGDTNNQTSSSSTLSVLVLDPTDVIFRNGYEAVVAGCPSM